MKKYVFMFLKGLIKLLSFMLIFSFKILQFSLVLVFAAFKFVMSIVLIMLGAGAVASSSHKF